MTRRVLSEEVKIFIVTRWAMFDKATEIMHAVKEEFGVDITVENAKFYRIDGPSSKAVGKKWRILFDETRKKYLEELASHPVAHRAYRIAQLGKITEEAMKAKNYKLAQSAMEQAAKETGNAFTNEINVKGGVKHTVEDVTPEERRAFVMDRLANALNGARDRADTQH